MRRNRALPGAGPNADIASNIRSLDPLSRCHLPPSCRRALNKGAKRATRDHPIELPPWDHASIPMPPKSTGVGTPTVHAQALLQKPNYFGSALVLGARLWRHVVRCQGLAHSHCRAWAMTEAVPHCTHTPFHELLPLNIDTASASFKAARAS